MEVREQIRQDLRAEMATGEDEADEPPGGRDFGFWHDKALVRRVVQILKYSNWVSWPDPGTSLDQSEHWLDDIFTYMEETERVRWEMKHGLTADYEEQEYNETQVRRFEDL